MKPILMNTEMVKAILDNRKTVTRRLIKPQPNNKLEFISASSDKKRSGKWIDDKNDELWTPPYHSRDVLYVRETWYQTPNGQYWYKADNICIGCTEDGWCLPKGVLLHKTCELCEYMEGYDFIKWRPSIHMPKEAARIFLRVTDVRVERLRPMGLDDLESEGIKVLLGFFSATEQFAYLWERTITKSDLGKYGWEANPYVWVIEFERIRKEEALEYDKR